MSRHLMARFRRSASDGDLSFDWRPHPQWPLHHYAPLENGDQLWVTGERGRERPGLTSWEWMVVGGPGATDGPRAQFMDGETRPIHDGNAEGEFLHDPREAMLAAEAAWKATRGRGMFGGGL